MANVSVGQEAPDFTLRDENNQEATLLSLRGAPVVLVFYPAELSPICTTELCGIRYVTHNPPLQTRDHKEALAALGRSWPELAM